MIQPIQHISKRRGYGAQGLICLLENRVEGNRLVTFEEPRMKRLFKIMGQDVTKPEPLWGRALLVATLICLGYYTEKVFGIVLFLNDL